VPQVTVVMATYNWAPVLPYSIGTVLEQSFRDLELLVVGDGCTDESADVVGAIDDPRVRWINLPANTGHQAGPNTEGVRQASGSLIAYLGHDDLWLPDHLATLVPAVAGDVGLAHATTMMVHPRRPLATFPEPGWQLGARSWIPPTTVVHRRDLAEAVGGWRPPSATGALDPEADFWLRLADRGATRWVDRLTSVKLSATARRDVYRTRPSFEQAWWVELIRSSDDPAAAVREVATRPYPFAEAEEASHLHGWPRLRWGAVSRWNRLRGRPRLSAEERLRIRRHTKGLDR
jgi:glycosyltransferase involved in cell wall biosynthesis